MQEQLTKIIASHRNALDKSFTPPQIEILNAITREFIKTLKNGGKLLFCGNGGSAADSQHIAAEFVGRFKKDRRGLAAIALTTDTSIITAVANDYGYESIFSRQVEALAQKGDVLIAMSTSGMSKNVLNAVAKAKEQGVLTIGLSGRDGGELSKCTDLCFIANADETSHIQEMHLIALHAISEVVEETFFGA